ncbi:hypothetical protein OPW41_19800 [Vibrio europaeus]|uniref:Uncharacterized protein n=1 Tax=Vibrio europaeus TaxID=300876 RepID=A0A178JF31_9VIBR|nr:hypothetical protein [Vibrio europaeus]MDC5707061.1 hypothetical protein [Vibrio europaeus]MDC5712426.1 hypothetical protein [Vibrio europaeus]MDC5717069.1 hypothetical protein [Vibrio europaeus]MDC5721397.1 hypothetical protein [Vibrio europaeus]MDC5726369.1 hypothetical protein [Vibrio europaeus]
MKRTIVAMLLAAISTFAAAADNACLSKKYDAYIDASLHWYEDLSTLTSEQYPELEEVSKWFLEGRKNHFELNRAAVHYYLEQDPAKVATNQAVEAWLQLEQKDIKVLASRSDELGQLAKVTFGDRQAKPHEKNYELRSAFADLLSHPTKIDAALKRYNASIKEVEAINCK